MITLVKEKETRILIMMQMNGMKKWAFYFVHYVEFFILHIIASAVFIITGVASQLDFFTRTDPGVYIILFILWGNAQIVIAYFISTFFNKSRTAFTLTFFLVIASVIINIVLNQILGTDKAPNAYLFWPFFAFYRGISLINRNANNDAAPPYSLKLVKPGDELFSCFIALAFEIFFYGFLTYYLDAVLPSEFGVQRKWYFPIESLFRRKKNAGTADVENFNREVDQAEVSKEDDDVRAERERVYSNQYPPNCPLVLKNMRKLYGNGKLAVKSVSLAVESNICFGLLGPNG